MHHKSAGEGEIIFPLILAFSSREKALSAMQWLLRQTRLKQAHGLAAVADFVFIFLRQFCAGHIQFWQPEQRVVAKAISAAGSFQNFACPDALENLRQRVIGIPHQSQHADEHAFNRFAAFAQGFQFLQQGFIIGCVIAVLAGKARGSKCPARRLRLERKCRNHRQWPACRKF